MENLDPSAAAFTDLVLEIFRLNGLLLAAGDRMTRPVGLTSARWQVLGVVEHGPIPVASIARSMGLTRQSVQQTADALGAEGFVEYLENPHHRRAKLVSITSRGREALEYVAGRQRSWAGGIGGRHPAESLRAAVEVLRQVRESLERDDPSEEPRG